MVVNVLWVNPKPETRNPKPETRNPKPNTRNAKPETLNAVDIVIFDMHAPSFSSLLSLQVLEGP